MKRTLGVFIASCVVALICSPVRAGAILSVVPATIPANPGDGADGFDVVLTNTGSSITVASFNFEVSVTTPNITLTGASFSTVADPYIFAGHSFDQDILTPLNFTSGQTLDANDTYDVPGSGVTLTNGESLSLGYVMFSVANSATAGPFAVSFTGTPNVTDANNLSDPSGNPVPISTFSGGTIDISGATTPEPSSFLLTLAGAGALAGWTRRRRRVA
jgi:hypothetical protein